MSRGLWRFDLTNSASPGGPADTISMLLSSLPSSGTDIRTFRLGIARQHTLNAYTNTLDVVHRTPSLTIQQVQTYNTIRVDVRVQRYLSHRVFTYLEGYLWSFDRVGRREDEAQPVCRGGWVERVVENGEVHRPFAEVGSGDEGDAWREGALDLRSGQVSVWNLWVGTVGEASLCELFLQAFAAHACHVGWL